MLLPTDISNGNGTEAMGWSATVDTLWKGRAACNVLCILSVCSALVKLFSQSNRTAAVPNHPPNHPYSRRGNVF